MNKPFLAHYRLWITVRRGFSREVHAKVPPPPVAGADGQPRPRERKDDEGLFRFRREGQQRRRQQQQLPRRLEGLIRSIQEDQGLIARFPRSPQNAGHVQQEWKGASGRGMGEGGGGRAAGTENGPGILGGLGRAWFVTSWFRVRGCDGDDVRAYCRTFLHASPSCLRASGRDGARSMESGSCVVGVAAMF